MAQPRSRWRAVMAIGALAAIGLGACGGGGGGSEGSAAEPVERPRAAGPEAPERRSAIPEVTVLDVASGAEFALASLVPSDRPILIWVWAPN